MGFGSIGPAIEFKIAEGAIGPSGHAGPAHEPWVRHKKRIYSAGTGGTENTDASDFTYAYNWTLTETYESLFIGSIRGPVDNDDCWELSDGFESTCITSGNLTFTGYDLEYDAELDQDVRIGVNQVWTVVRTLIDETACTWTDFWSYTYSGSLEYLEDTTEVRFGLGFLASPFTGSTGEGTYFNETYEDSLEEEEWLLEAKNILLGEMTAVTPDCYVPADFNQGRTGSFYKASTGGVLGFGAKKISYRWRIQAAAMNAQTPSPDGWKWFKVSWDIFNFPADYDPLDPESPQPNPVNTDLTWEWLGPGDAEDVEDDSWFSELFVIPIPTEEGSSNRIANVRYQPWRSPSVADFLLTYPAPGYSVVEIEPPP